MLIAAWGCDAGYLEPAGVKGLDDAVDQGALPGRTQPFYDNENGYAVLLALTLEVSKLLPLLLNLLEQGLARLGCAFHRPRKQIFSLVKRYVLIVPSIDLKSVKPLSNA